MIEITFAEIFNSIWLAIVDILKVATMVGGAALIFALIAGLIILSIIILAWLRDGCPIKNFKKWLKGDM